MDAGTTIAIVGIVISSILCLLAMSVTLYLIRKDSNGSLMKSLDERFIYLFERNKNLIDDIIESKVDSIITDKKDGILQLVIDNVVAQEVGSVFNHFKKTMPLKIVSNKEGLEQLFIDLKLKEYKQDMV